MADFTAIKPQFNTGSEGTPTWTDGSFVTAGFEIRWCAAGAGTTTTASASWPQYARPASVGVVPELWAYSADAVGLKVAYDGTLTSRARVARINYDALGTFAAAPTLSAWGDNTHVAPVAGTQPGAFAGSPIVNGHATDTSSTSYLKGNMYGTAGTTDPTSGNVGTTLAATSGTAGSVSPGAGAWLATWQSLQGAIQFITFTTTPPATTAGNIWIALSLWTGPNMSLGTITPVVTLTYSYV